MGVDLPYIGDLATAKFPILSNFFEILNAPNLFYVLEQKAAAQKSRSYGLLKIIFWLKAR